MSGDLQGLVDALGTSLQRPVCVDDARFRLVAYKEHDIEQVDSVRLAKLLHRQAGPHVQAWLEEHGARTAERLARIPRNPELDMARRILIPLRFDGMLLGWLALIDEPRPLSDAELDETLRYAPAMSVALFQELRLQHDERRPEVAVIRELLGLVSGSAQAHRDEITARGYIAVAPGYACIVARAFARQDGPLPVATRVGIAAVFEGARRLVPPHHVIPISAGDEAIAVLAVANPADADAVAGALADRLCERIGPDFDAEALIGVGGLVATVSELKVSLEQARCAIQVARHVSGHAPFARWAELGSYGTVARLLSARTSSLSMLPAAMSRLLEHAEAETLITTLETYLDNGGDAVATAGALYMHRTSLYPRLRRIEKIAGVELASGDARLELHLGLRLWRLARAA
jgi:DNA-binding PucR family transcriptional regulator